MSYNCGFFFFSRFKNNVSYPWTSNVSNFKTDSSSRNQTLHADKLNSADAGTYTCLITSHDSVQRREIPLEVYGEY